MLVAFLFVIFAVIQAGCYLRARGDARSAAAACAEAARGETAGSGQGRSAGAAVANSSGFLQSSSVAVSTSGRQVRCTVSGQALHLIDLGLSGLSETAAMPKDGVR